MSHIPEVYFSPIEAFIPDRVNEGLLKACIKYGPIALKKSDRLRGTSRMWASTLAINGIGGTGCGTVSMTRSSMHLKRAYELGRSL